METKIQIYCLAKDKIEEHNRNLKELEYVGMRYNEENFKRLVLALRRFFWEEIMLSKQTII